MLDPAVQKVSAAKQPGLNGKHKTQETEGKESDYYSYFSGFCAISHEGIPRAKLMAKKLDFFLLIAQWRCQEWT